MNIYFKTKDPRKSWVFFVFVGGEEIFLFVKTDSALVTPHPPQSKRL
jgi:hypothetical protein